MRIILLAVILTVLSASTTFAITGSIYVQVCADDPKTNNSGLCIGYTAGVLEYIVTSKETKKLSDRLCFPQDFTSIHLKNDTVEFLMDDPSYLDRNASEIIKIVLVKKYLCEK